MKKKNKLAHAEGVLRARSGLVDDSIVKPMYSIPQLAKLIHYSSQGARQFLFKLNLPIHLVGSRYIVYLTDLQTYTPELYNSILEAANINSINEQNEIIEDNESFMKEQFYSQENKFIKDY